MTNEIRESTKETIRALYWDIDNIVTTTITLNAFSDVYRKVMDEIDIDTDNTALQIRDTLQEK